MKVNNSIVLIMVQAALGPLAVAIAVLVAAKAMLPLKARKVAAVARYDYLRFDLVIRI